MVVISVAKSCLIGIAGFAGFEGLPDLLFQSEVGTGPKIQVHSLLRKEV
jgi:hypothetical protein